MSTPRPADLTAASPTARGPGAPLPVALLAHAIALVGVFLMPALGIGLPLSVAALIEGIAASAVGRLLGLPMWWVPINLVFVPVALLVAQTTVAPLWYLAAFALLALLYWSTFRTRVPLYLSSREACRALLQLIPDEGAAVLDLGCGFGGVVARTARACPNAGVTGLELAPVPSLIAWLRLRRVPNAKSVHADFWKHDLSRYDLVYAFLSPVAMARLWQKARAQMKPGSLLVSNSFIVEGIRPDRIIGLPGRDSRALYVWRM